MFIHLSNWIALTQPTAPAANGSSGGSIGTSHGGLGETTAFAALGSSTTDTAGSASTLSTTNTPPLFTLPSQGAATGSSSRFAMPPHASAMTASIAPAVAPMAPQAVPTNAPTANLPFSTLDVNAGQVFYPGAYQLATLGGNVELRAQLKNASGASFNWNTAGLTNATAITGAATADLTFQWNTSNSTATTNSATLAVTSGGATTSQTYTFQVPAGSGATAGTGTTTWPQVLSPDAVSPSAPTLGVHYGTVDANSGSFDTMVALPSYNPNVPAVTLAYDSITANPQPILDVHHTLDPSQAVPTQVATQLTFNGAVGSTVYTNTSALIPGDVQQIALQANASSLATGR